MLIRSRRGFLRDAIRSVSAVGALGGLAKFGEMNAMAAGLRLPGAGMHYPVGWQRRPQYCCPHQHSAAEHISVYQSARGALGIAQNSLLPINNGSDVYGLHPELPEIQGLYQAGWRQCWRTSACSCSRLLALSTTPTTVRSCRMPSSRIPIKPASGSRPFQQASVTPVGADAWPICSNPPMPAPPSRP